MNPKRILLVEDDPHDVELTLRALAAAQNLADEVQVVHDGVQALDYLLRRGEWAERPGSHPVVVLLDIKLPLVDGLEVLRQMKTDPELRFLPVVILTSSREERDIVESYRLGINAYVVKPLTLKEFTAAIKELGVFWALLNQPPPIALIRRHNEATLEPM